MVRVVDDLGRIRYALVDGDEVETVGSGRRANRAFRESGRVVFAGDGKVIAGFVAQRDRPDRIRPSPELAHDVRCDRQMRFEALTHGGNTRLGTAQKVWKTI